MKCTRFIAAVILAAATAATAQELTTTRAAAIADPAAGPQPVPMNVRATLTITPMMETIGLVEELRDLRWAVGRWAFRQERVGAEDGEEADLGTVTGRVGPGGRSIILDALVSQGPNEGSSTHEVIVWSASERLFEIYTFDGNSPPTVARGSFQNGSFTFKRKHQIDGKTVRTQVRYDGVTRSNYVRTSESVTEGSRSATVLRMSVRKDF